MQRHWAYQNLLLQHTLYLLYHLYFHQLLRIHSFLHGCPRIPHLTATCTYSLHWELQHTLVFETPVEALFYLIGIGQKVLPDCCFALQ